MKSLFVILFLSLSSLSFSQTDCKFLKDCELKYDDGNVGTVIIKNNKHIEYYENGKYFIKSDLEWISDCEYNATLTEATLPDFPFKPGVVMNVKFEKIEGKVITGTGSIEGGKFPVRFVRVK
jgi:hypothetical protein